MEVRWKWGIVLDIGSEDGKEGTVLRLFAYARGSIWACPTMKRTGFSSDGLYARILAGFGSDMMSEKRKPATFLSLDLMSLCPLEPHARSSTWRPKIGFTPD